MKLTPLHWAALKSDAAAVAMLLSAGANVDLRDTEGSTALTNACLVGSEACVEQLIAFGADVNAGDKYDYRPIHCAVKGNATGALLSMLLSNGADIDDARNMFGRSPLVRAASSNSNISCQYLLENGADVDLPDQEGNPPLFEAATKNAHNTLELQLAWNARYLHVKNNGQTLLHTVAVGGDKRTFDILAAAKLQGFDANARDSTSMTARQLFTARSGVSNDTAAAFGTLLASLTGVRESNRGNAGDENDSDEEESEFFEALEFVA